MRFARVLVASLVAPVFAAAGQVQTIRLDKPAVTHPAEWTDVVGVVEFGNGKLVVLDARDRAVRFADMNGPATTLIGRRGAGPGEYELPLKLFGLPGDSAVIVDMANNGRSLVVTPDGKIANYILTSRTAPFITDRSVADSRGRIYRAGMRRVGLGTTGLTGHAIERLDRRTGRVDTAGYVSRHNRGCAFSAAPSPQSEESPKAAIAARSQPAYTTVEQWAIAPDGRLAVVCPNPYRVLIIDPAGQRVEGPVIPYQPVRVTDREKAEWREARQQPAASMMVNADGKTVGTYRREPPPREPDWPEALPPFEAGRLLSGPAMFAPDGLLWVHRMVASGAPAQYDIIARDGALRYRVMMPPRSRVVGFGNRGIYAVTLDSDDVQRLSRFAFPSMNNR
jgi:hypothetical protein